MKFSYISNLSKDSYSGGGNGVNSVVFNHLNSKFVNLEYQCLNPKVIFYEKWISRIFKIFKVKRLFYFFSKGRLNEISKKFNEIKDVDFYFFHGSTSWIDIKPKKDYFVFIDACFYSYISMYNPAQYSNDDLLRIYKMEAIWLKNAKKVFFRSKWAMDETIRNYNLIGDNFQNIGRGGFMEIPEKDYYKPKNKLSLLYISTMFELKGGPVVLESFKLLKSKIDAELHVIGEIPSKKEYLVDGVNYHGFLRKSDKEQLAKLTYLFQNASFLIHPTFTDTNPIVISELNYFGCPAISSNLFGIPELIIHNKTGFLLENHTNPKEIMDIVFDIYVNKQYYNEMRDECRLYSIKNHTWEIVLEKMTKTIEKK